MGVGSAPRTGRLYPRERPDTHCTRLGGPQGRSGQVRKISPPPGLDPRTVHPVASGYTDYATRPTEFLCYRVKMFFLDFMRTYMESREFRVRFFNLTVLILSL